MPQIASHQFDHDGVIQKPQTGNVVGNQVVRLDKIRQAVQRPLDLGCGQFECIVGYHRHHHPQELQSLFNEGRYIRVFQLGKQFARRRYDLLRRRFFRRFASLLHDQVEMTQVIVAEIEADPH